MWNSVVNWLLFCTFFYETDANSINDEILDWKWKILILEGTIEWRLWWGWGSIKQKFKSCVFKKRKKGKKNLFLDNDRIIEIRLYVKTRFFEKDKSNTHDFSSKNTLHFSQRDSRVLHYTF